MHIRHTNDGIFDLLKEDQHPYPVCCTRNSQSYKCSRVPLIHNHPIENHTKKQNFRFLSKFWQSYASLILTEDWV